jgi:hypothetical protein
MYLGTIYISTEFRPDRTSNMENQQSAITPELMAGLAPNFTEIFDLGRYSLHFYQISTWSDFKYCQTYFCIYMYLHINNTTWTNNI